MTKRQLAAVALRRSGLGWLLRRLPGWKGLLVLNYHRIGDGSASRWDEDIFSADEESFDAQLDFFKREFDVIRAEDLEDVRGRRDGRYVQITFDDGYRDNFEVAVPILRANGLTATFFVATGFLDQGNVPWWEDIAWMVRGATRAEIPAFPGSARPIPLLGAKRLEVVRALLRRYGELPEDRTAAFLDALGEVTGTGRCPTAEARSLWMTWDMVREMRRAGMTIGGHTVNHIPLARFGRAAQLAEIAGSRARIEAELGEPIRLFSYPYGGRQSFNGDTRSCVAEAGFDLAYSYYGGFQRPGEWDKLDLKRVAVEAVLSKDLLMAMMTLPQILA